MRARDVMTRPVITVRTDTPVRRATVLLTEHRITAMPVLDENGELVGMVSESDLLTGRLPHDPRSHLRRDLDPVPDPPATVAEVMTTPVVSVSGTADAADVAEMMLTADVRSLPVVEGSAVVGIVSRRDLLGTLVRDDDVIESQVRHRLEEFTADARHWDVHSEHGRVTVAGHFPDDLARRVAQILTTTVAGVLAAELTHRPDPAAAGR